MAVGLLFLGNLPSEAFLGGTGIHPPPTTGGYAYYSTYGSFGPDRAGFVAKGQTFVDPIFGSTIRRLTSEFPNASQSDIYSKNGFWNANGTRMAHQTPAGYTIIDTTTGATVRSGVPGNYDGSFAPDNSDLWYYSSGASLRSYSISSGTTALVKTFSATLNSLGGSTDWIDASGRYMVLKIGTWGRVWDKATDTLYAGNIPFTSDTGWMGISPDGKYVITAGEWKLTSFAIDHATKSVNTTGVLFWTSCGDHGDIVSASDGKTYLVAGECHEEAAIYAVDVTIPQTADNIAKQRADNRKLFYYDWNDDWHMSAPSRGVWKDWIYLSIESYDDGFTSTVSSWRPYKQEIVMANVLTGEVRRLAHHRSRGLAQSYYHQPRVSASWDGAKVAWASNFGYAGTGYSDIYAIDVSGGGSTGGGGGGGADTAAPTVAMTSPAPSATVSGVVRMTATASDNVGVVGVQFYINSTKWGPERTVAPYVAADWDTRFMSNGTYTLKAVARDAAGNSRTATVTVILKHDTTAPTVAMTSPAAAATVSGIVRMTATASDDVRVVGVQFYVNATKWGPERTVAPYVAADWDTRFMSNGTYTLKAVARDPDGNTKTATITVTVKNGGSGTTTGTVQNVVWTSATNVMVSGNTVTKSAGCGGCPDAGAASVQAIPSGAGYVEFKATTGPMGYLGLRGSATYLGTSMPFALNFQGSYVTVYESGVYRADVSFVTGTVFRIEIEGGVVKYKKNGTTFYTSGIRPAYPLRAVAALNDVGARVTTAVMKAATVTSSTPAAPAAPTVQTVAWTRLANVTLRDGVMTKTAGCDGCPDAGGRSLQRIASGGGYVQVTAVSPSKVGYVGLTNGSTIYDATALPFALAFEDRYVSVYESGAYRADVPLSAGDVFRIAVSATGAVSYLRNGTVFYRSALRASYPLRAAAALYDVGATVMRAVMLGIR